MLVFVSQDDCSKGCMIMMNLHNKKTKKVIAGIIVLLVVFAMILPLFLF